MMTNKELLQHFKIDDLDEELKSNKVSKTRHKEIKKFYNKFLGNGPYYCISPYNPVWDNITITVADKTKTDNKLRKPFKFGLYGKPVQLYKAICEFENNYIPCILQVAEVTTKEWIMTQEPYLYTAYLPVSIIDNL